MGYDYIKDKSKTIGATMKKIILSFALAVCVLLSFTSADHISGDNAKRYVRLITDSSREAARGAEILKEAFSEYGICLSADISAQISLTLALDDHAMPPHGYSISCSGGQLSLHASDLAAMLAAAKQLSNGIAKNRLSLFGGSFEYIAQADESDLLWAFSEYAEADTVTVDAESGILYFFGISREAFISCVSSVRLGTSTVAANGSFGSSLFYVLSNDTYTLYAAYFAGDAHAEIGISREALELDAMYDAGNDCAPLMTVIPSSGSQALAVRLRDGSFLVCGNADADRISEILIEQSPQDGRAIIALWLTEDGIQKPRGDIEVIRTDRPHSYGAPISLNGGSVTCFEGGLFEIKLDGHGSYLFSTSNISQLQKYGELPRYSATVAISEEAARADVHIFSESGDSSVNQLYLGGKAIVFNLPISVGSAYALLPK